MTNIANISAYFQGQTQDQHLLPALDASTFQIDERGTADFLAFTVKFGKALSYFNPQNSRDGNWQQLLLNDQIMLLAYIMKTDCAMEFPRYLDYRDGIMANTELNTRKLFTQQFFSIGFHIVLRINRWYKLANQSLTHHPFRNYLNQTIVEEGRIALENYYLLYFKLCEWRPGFKNESLAKLESLDRIWLFEPFPWLSMEDCLGNVTAKDTIFLQETVNIAVSVGQSLFHLQEKIIEAAGKYFKASVNRSNIAPHIGLFLTFLDLLKYQQADLNLLTQSHLDFYYTSILGFKPLAALPDQTFVAFELAKGYTSFSLPKQTELSAGTAPNGSPILFSTQEGLTINGANITNYQTLNFLPSADAKKLEGLYVGTYAKFNALSAASWPFFGATNSTDSNYSLKEQMSSLGFAISCPDLILNSGDRTIQFQLLPQTMNTNPVGTSEPLTIAPLFNLKMTTAKGWTTFVAEQISIVSIDAPIQFSIHLLTSDPAIVPYNKKVHGLGYETEWPVCQVSIANGILRSNFEVLSEFKIHEIKINTSVDRMKEVVVQTDKGKVAPNKPFFPFGTTPLPDANLYIGGQELFVKPLSSIDFEFDWDHLPTDFTTYYQEYPGLFNNQSFLANLSYFSPENGEWNLLELKNKDYQFSLFETDTLIIPIPSNSEIVKDLTISQLSDALEINLDIDGVIAPQPDLLEFKNFTNELSSAFFKLTFIAPSQGFGTEEYPQVLSKVTLENAQAIIVNSQNCLKPPSNASTVQLCDVIDQYNTDSEATNLKMQTTLLGLNQVKSVLHDAIVEVRKKLTNCQNVNSCETAIHSVTDGSRSVIQMQLKAFKNEYKLLSQNVSTFYDQSIKEIDALKKKITPELTVDNEQELRDKNTTAIDNLTSQTPIDIDGILTDFDNTVAQPINSTGQVLVTQSQKDDWINSFETNLQAIETTIQNNLELSATNLSVFNDLATFYDAWSAEVCKCIPLKAQPNKPYIPKINNLSINYTAASDWTLGPAATPAFQLYQLSPLGSQIVDLTTPQVKLMPDITNQSYSFFGFKNLEAGNRVTILFNITSQQTEIIGEQEIAYDYLSETGWQSLNLSSDGTYGFQQTGILQFLVPEDITDQSSLMPLDSFWLRLSKSNSSTSTANSSCDLGDGIIRCNFIQTQAVEVQRNMEEVVAMQPIKIGSITATVSTISAIKKIVQPQASSGGQAAETQAKSYQRTAYRLNNKGRAVNLMDLENMLLQNFEELYKVTTIPMGYETDEPSNEVKVMVVPYTETTALHPYRPLLTPSKLKTLADFCNECGMPSMELKVVNPCFYEIGIVAYVQFVKQNEKGLLSSQLNTDLKNYLSPWIKDNPLTGQTNSNLTLETLRSFISSRSYVESLGYLCFQKRSDLNPKKITSCIPPDLSALLKPWDLVVPTFENFIYDLKDQPASITNNSLPLSRMVSMTTNN